jgi:methionyl aminopeptidase
MRCLCQCPFSKDEFCCIIEGMNDVIYNNQRIQGIKKSCKAAVLVMEAVENSIREGVATVEIEAAAYQAIEQQGGRSAFLGYRGFPGVVCISINEEVLHGIPSHDRIVKRGDMIKVDLGVVLNGWYSDMASTFLVDDGSESTSNKRRLKDATISALMAGISAAKAGNTTKDVASAIQTMLSSRGFEPVDGMTGLGVGLRLHESPIVPNRVEGCKCDDVLVEGMTIAIEPMVGMGSPKAKVKHDGWTLIMADGQPSAHFEHTVLITNKGPEILTIKG